LPSLALPMTAQLTLVSAVLFTPSSAPPIGTAMTVSTTSTLSDNPLISFLVSGVGSTSASTLNECLKTCDNTPGCVDVSWVIGTPGTCYMKGSIGPIRENSNIYGGRQISGCTKAPTLKLHRKRVVREPKLNKRLLPVGPDFTFLQSTVFVARTSTTTQTVATV
jgi:hypothetical protein